MTISKLIDDNELISLTETFFTGKITNSFLQTFFTYHQIIRTDCETKLVKDRQGGSMLAVPNHMTCTKEFHHSNGYTESCGIIIQDIDLQLISTYVPGDT